MTLMDAPQYDEAKEKRKATFWYAGVGLVFVLFVGWWLAASRPIDWPWNWNHYLFGRIRVNRFLKAVEADDLAKAYGIWIHDKNWQQHPNEHGSYPFSRFVGDWSPTSPDNEYGAIRSHKIVLAGRYGNGVLVAILINGRRSDALDLAYDPPTDTLSFSPPDVRLYLGP